MRHEILPDGTLRIHTESEERERLVLEHYSETGKGYSGANLDIIEMLQTDCDLYAVEPHWIAALTDAPILTDLLEFPEDEHPTLGNGARVWWFQNYMIQDPWEALAKRGYVDFTEAPADKEVDAGNLTVYVDHTQARVLFGASTPKNVQWLVATFPNGVWMRDEDERPALFVPGLRVEMFAGPWEKE